MGLSERNCPLLGGFLRPPALREEIHYFTPGAAVRLLSLSRTLSRYAERLATHEATFQLLTRLRMWAWQKILPLSAKNMQGLRQGELLNRLVADIDTLDHLYLRLITPVLAAAVMLCGLFVFVAFIDLELALILCTSMAVIWLILPWIFYLMGRGPGIRQLESKRVLRVRVLEFVQGLAEVSLFGAADGVGVHKPPGPIMAMVAFMALACFEMLIPAAGAFQHLSACIQRKTPDIWIISFCMY